jgi:monoamine oxidase
MPRRSLELLAPASPPLQELTPLIASVTPRPLFKLFTYPSPWWRTAGRTGADGFVPLQSGRTLTDLPVRQTYYWPQEDGSPATAGPAMLMASYDDGTNIGFWDGLRPRRGQAWQRGREVAQPEDAFAGEGAGAAASGEWGRYRASRRMVAEVARQLGTMHGLDYTPAVRHAAFRDWGDDPYGGGWNSWNIGVRSWEVKEQIVRPLGDRPLFICGEAYSDAQGWVEGALQTADMMLEHFGLSYS